MRKILAVIPARSGSKSVIDKNIRLINDKPMIAFSIEHALQSKYINRIIVSTDSEKYAAIAREYGAETPFIRPSELATDTALDIDVFEHTLNYLEKNEEYIPDIVVHLRPTYPIRSVSDIDRMIEIMIENPNVDSVRSISKAKELAYKMWFVDESKSMEPILKNIPEAYNMPRQQLPTIYYQNACIDIIKPSVISEQHSMTGKEIKGYEIKHNFDIDTEEDFFKAEQYLKLLRGKNRFVFDIDGVIANYNPNLDYDNSEPNQEMINVINNLFEGGNEIILFTARGYVTGYDWENVTKKQMENWGVKFHELKFGKPNADFYIDDKMLSIFDCLDLLS